VFTANCKTLPLVGKEGGMFDQRYFWEGAIYMKATKFKVIEPENSHLKKLVINHALRGGALLQDVSKRIF
jgi:hypothetical protein